MEHELEQEKKRKEPHKTLEQETTKEFEEAGFEMARPKRRDVDWLALDTKHKWQLLSPLRIEIQTDIDIGNVLKDLKRHPDLFICRQRNEAKLRELVRSGAADLRSVQRIPPVISITDLPQLLRNPIQFMQLLPHKFRATSRAPERPAEGHHRVVMTKIQAATLGA